MSNYIISTRRIERGEFISEPGGSTFLRFPKNKKSFSPKDKINKGVWFKEVRAQSSPNVNPVTGKSCGDILVFVHGYNTSIDDLVTRHNLIREGLEAEGFQGIVVSFDWPSGSSALNYLEDREDAKLTAFRLVKDCIEHLASNQKFDCEINVHVLAHSAGAYVVREAFDDADDRPPIAEQNWTVSQVLFVAADVSSISLATNNPKSSSLFRHSIRLTNYSNPYDRVLKLSNAKRIGVSPRAGRVGLPKEPHPKSINVNCGHYYNQNKEILGEKVDGAVSHSWYFYDSTFIKDIYLTMSGDIDRNMIPTRAYDEENVLSLVE
ncbi:MAG: alpha/beta hydrolase [Chloroflexota bacterium]